MVGKVRRINNKAGLLIVGRLSINNLRRIKNMKHTTARHNVKYTKRYANLGRRKKVAHEHQVNRENNLLGNPTGLPKMKRTYC